MSNLSRSTPDQVDEIIIAVRNGEMDDATACAELRRLLDESLNNYLVEKRR